MELRAIPSTTSRISAPWQGGDQFMRKLMSSSLGKRQSIAYNIFIYAWRFFGRRRPSQHRAGQRRADISSPGALQRHQI